MKNLPVYTIQEFNTTTSDFYVSDLPSHLAKHHFIHKPHKHNFYLCVLFTKGSGIHEIDFVKYEIKPGSVFFLSPGQFHHWEFDTEIEGCIFFHSKEFYDLNYQNRQLQNFPFYFSAYNSPVLYANEEQLHKVCTLIEWMMQEFSSKKHYQSLKLCSLVDLVYIEFSRSYIFNSVIEKKKSDYVFKLSQLEDLVSAHFQSLKKPSEYANLMNVSAKHLNRIVKESLNKTITEFIADRIVLEAKRMLIHADNRVVEVAIQLGFEDPSYFNRYFKKHTGLTPVQFALQYKEF